MKKIMKKSRKILVAILTPVLTVAVGVSALIGALAGAGNNNRKSPFDIADGTTAVNPNTITIAGDKIDAGSRSGVQELINYVNGTPTVKTTYQSLESNMSSWTKTWSSKKDSTNTVKKVKTADQFTEKTVTLGGIEWNVMYVSTADYTANGTNKGDIIVTLWQADVNTSYMSQYNEWYADTPTAKYPSAMYGSSKLRSSLVGSSYVKTNGATTLTAGSQNSHWAPFTTESTETSGGFAEVLATPANMLWQQYENAPEEMPKTPTSYTAWDFYPWYFPNDAWGDIGNKTGSVQTAGGVWYNKTDVGNYNYSDNETSNNGVYKADSAYTAWKNDTLWLPSMSETGWGDSNWISRYDVPGSGLWNANATQRGNTNNGSSNNTSSGIYYNYAWLRSGGLANYAYGLGSSGGGNYGSCTNTLAVRPALHLNLKSAAQAAGLFEQSIQYHSEYGTAPVDPDGKYTPGDTSELPEPTGVPANLEFAGWAKGGYKGEEVITTLEGQNDPLDLYATFKPTAASAAPTPADKNLSVYYGATDVSLSAAISHALLSSGEYTVSTYWKKAGSEDKIVSGDGITVANGENASLTFAKPPKTATGEYTLYYTLTPTDAEAEKGLRPLADTEACTFTLTVNGAQAKVEEKPTLGEGKIYVGQGILGTQLVGGRVSCATANDNNVAGTWAITSEGVFTSSGKIYAKFTPDDSENIAAIENVEIDTNAEQLYIKMTEDVSGIAGLTPNASKDLKVDYGCNVTFTIADGKVTFNLKQDGEDTTAEYAIKAPVGYTPYLHRSESIDPSKSEITNESALLKNIASGKQFTVGYRANDVSYKIYYILQPTVGDYITATTADDLDALIADGTSAVYKYEGTAPTGSEIAPLNAENKPWNPAVDFVERTVDEGKTGVSGTVKGDGSSVALVYLKLNEYTVIYSAAGAYPSSQSQSFRYGAFMTAPKTAEPTKSLSSFNGWFTAPEGGDKVSFGTVPVTANTTVYAQYKLKEFKVLFELNVGDGEGQLPSADSVKLTENGGDKHGGKVKWDTDTLFDSSFKFADGAGAGEYSVTYTVDNIKSNKRINGIVPSAIGYVFDGWFAVTENADGEEVVATSASTVIRVPNSSTADEIVLRAKWSRAQYSIRLDEQNGNRVTSKRVPNITAWNSILPETDPVRGGYKFVGWYVTTDESSGNYLTVDYFSRSVDESGAPVFSVSDFIDAGLFTDGGSSITVYAVWKSLPIILEPVTSSKGSLSFTMDGEELSDDNPTVYIGKEVTVTVTAEAGYAFKNIVFILKDGTKETLRDGVKTFTVTSRLVCKGVDELSGEEYNLIKIGADYSEQRYTITYHTDGGRAADSVFARSYSPSELLDESENRAKLPSLLTKNGYDFAGWIFGSTEDWANPQYAHGEVPEGESIYGADLWLVQPFSLDDEQKPTYRNVTLKAMWTPQPATVYLYNATYSELQYNKEEGSNFYYINKDDEGYDLVTAKTVNIINPVRDSFDFLGWATSKGGAVVYPAVEGQKFIEYSVNPDHDASGSKLNANNLFAVWHVKGVNYIIMNADNNGATYMPSSATNAGVKMSAKPAQQYTSNDAAIKLTYYWYKVYNGMYDQCFTESDYVDKAGYMWYLDDNGDIVTYEKDGVYYASDKTTVLPAPLGTKFKVKDFNPDSIGKACFERFKRANVSASETPTITVYDVADSGTYICVIDVVATEGESGSTTRASGYGEIEITLNKAVYGGLSMDDKTVIYNATPRADEIGIKGLAVNIENGLRTVTLPDGSKVVVTYTYYLGAGELKENDSREPITDLSLIKNVGEYHVVASFAFAVDGDKGNYEPLASLEADLIIDKDVLSVLEYQFTHDGEKSELPFSGVYDGKAYGVDVIIKDTLTISAGSQFVTDVDDVAVEVKVYKVTENGDVEIPAEQLPTVGAGVYAVVITGLKGKDAGNYVLGEVKSRQEYTVTKQKYEVASHIRFNDLDNVVFDNEVHTLSVSFDDGYSLPDTVTATYERKSYEPEEKGFGSAEGDFRLSNDFNNGGRYAGVYTVTVSFKDSASDNYEALESMTANLTITKADFFNFYNVDGKDILRDSGFVSKSFSYTVDVQYHPEVANNFGLDKKDVSLTYAYYRVNEETNAKTELARGTHEELVEKGKEAPLISLAGKYEIVATVNYESALYRNNFKEVDESKTTITYVIDNRDIESVKVVEWKDGFDRQVKLGDAFDYSWIEQIDVVYKDGGGTLHVTGNDIKLASIKFEKKGGVETDEFWHVGTFNIKVSFYEKESGETYEFTVKQEITDYVLKYNVDGGAYAEVPEEGLELLKDGRTYGFIVEYSRTDESGTVTSASSDAVVAVGGLKLGKNVLTVTEEYYTFGEIAVNAYEILENVKWEYSTDGTNWKPVPDNNELIYAGRVYRVRAVYGEGVTAKTFEAATASGTDALNVNSYVMQVGRSGNYRIDETYSFRITPKKLAFTWNKNSFGYDMLSHVPSIVSSGLEEVDEGLVTFGFNYYDKDKNRILSAGSIVTVGQYYISVTLGGEATARGNYTLEGAENAEYYGFTITKAKINASVYYSESNYGRNISYAGNGELRLGALKADFGESAAIGGQFRFVDGEHNEISGKTFAELLENTGDITVNYVYIPDNKNYEELYGSLTLTVKEPSAKTGDGALSVEFGDGAIRFYLVNQKLDLYGIEVYQLYQSTYQENGVWYGARSLVENPVFRLKGYNGVIDSPENPYIITALDLSGGAITLIARNGTATGTLSIPVMDKNPTGIEVSNPDGYRTTYYVGETPDFADIKFKVLFGEDAPAVDDLTVGTITTDYTGGELTENSSGFSVTFTYASVSITLDFKVAAKENLEVKLPSNTVLTYTGEEIAVPEISFIVDGKTVGQNALNGVTVTVTVYKDGRISRLIEDGTYSVVYEINTNGNPRFNAHDPVTVEIEITKNPYKVDITVPDGEEVKLSTSYTGSNIDLPKPTVGEVTDSRDGSVVTGAVVRYLINGEELLRGLSDGKWVQISAKDYKVEVLVEVDGKVVGRAEYTYSITKAENAIKSLTTHTVVLGEDADFKFDVVADFGADTVVFTYATTRNGNYSATVPATAGKWFVKATIVGNDDYKGDEKVEGFEVRNAEIEVEDGKVEGGDGIGSGWTLKITEADVSEVSISQQEVLGGYSVELRNEDNKLIEHAENEYTVRIKLTEALSSKGNLKVFLQGENGASAKEAWVEDGYVVFKTSDFGRFIITNEIAVEKEPVGLLVAVIVLGVVAAGGIAACVAVFLKKKKKGGAR